VPPEGTGEHYLWDTSCLPGEQKIHDPDGIFLMPIPLSHKQYLIWQDSKPFEELYDIETDPEEINNLADDPDYAATVERMRTTLFDWMIETRDLGLIDETEIVVRAAKYGGVSYEVGTHCDNFVRILETADLARLGQKGKLELIERLADPDSAVRYWAVTGLMCFDWDAVVKQRLKELLQDESISVSLAAADEAASSGFRSRFAESGLFRSGAFISYRIKLFAEFL
jgi:hypothetical protein